MSVRNKLSIISGGPGTGKTSTVVRVLALILEQHKNLEQKVNIALAAPTGKAAARLKDSISNAKGDLDVSEATRNAIPEKTQTIHQLLGARRGSSQFRHNVDNPIPYDLVIIDEASMIDQALMSKLMEALLDDSQLILLGDKDQLASVEAGSVLGDICGITENHFTSDTADWLNRVGASIPSENITAQEQPLTDNITLLTKSYRFDAESGIGKLGEAINQGRADNALSILQDDQLDGTEWIKVSSPGELQQQLEEKIINYFSDIISSESPQQGLEAFNKFRLLSPHRRGPWGVTYLNRLIEKTLHQHGLIRKYKPWYAGKPVIVTVNNYAIGLFNGDTGICMPDEHGELKVYFSDDEKLRAITPSRLPTHNTAYALTVHKSQGSEFDEVMLVLPAKSSKVMSRELIYTALTRARTKISVAGNEKVFKGGVANQISRYSGLRAHLWK